MTDTTDTNGAAIEPSKLARAGSIALAVIPSAVFLQSLAFKFTGAPEPQHIFSTLDLWAADSFGISGLFAPGGIFSAVSVGIVELIAAIMMLVGTFFKKTKLLFAGAVVGMGVISGAIFFHLFTPLGIVVGGQGTSIESDGGTLFVMALITFAATATLAFLNKSVLFKRG